jgi:hypothetical protein
VTRRPPSRTAASATAAPSGAALAAASTQWPAVAAESCHRDDQRSGGSSRSVHEQPLAAVHAQAFVQHLNRGQCRDREGSGMRPRNLRRFGGEQGRLGHEPRRPASLLREWERMREHRIPDRPPLEPGTQGRNHARRRDTERHRRPSSQIPTSSPGELIPIADTGGFDLDQNLAGARRARVRHLQHRHTATEFFDPCDAHDRSPTTLATQQSARPRAWPDGRAHPPSHRL